MRRSACCQPSTEWIAEAPPASLTSAEAAFSGFPQVSNPALESLLAETFGVILYQEQVLRIANKLAGFSLVEADMLHRAMSHFDPGRQMQVLRQKFVAEAQRARGSRPRPGSGSGR